jgi:hypothetical protein
MTKDKLAEAIERATTESLAASVTMGLELQALRAGDDAQQAMQMLTDIAEQQAALLKGLADILGVVVGYLLELPE